MANQVCLQINPLSISKSVCKLIHCQFQNVVASTKSQSTYESIYKFKSLHHQDQISNYYEHPEMCHISW